MTHTILYLGRYDLNIDRLRSHTGHLETYRRRTEGGDELPTSAPSEKVDGIVFGLMQEREESLPGKKAFYAVAVENVVLANRIVLVPDRHTDGKGFGPTASLFGNESARALLKDIMDANKAQEAELGEIYRKHFGAM